MRVINPLINKAIDYIINNVDYDISIEDVASHCNYSKYHFSRLFKAETGISIYSFIKGMKMDQSAVSIKVEKDKTITDIGCDYGYSSSNYSSAFSKEYNTSPIKFREEISSDSTENPFHSGENDIFKPFEHYDEKIEIKNLSNIKVIYERYIENYNDIGENWVKFLNKYREYINENTLMIERSYNDPSISKLEKCIYDICISTDIEEENVTTIKGGKFAVYRFSGFIRDIFVNFQGIFNVWLPQSNYERDNRFALGIYRKIDWDKNYVVMDFCVPVK